METYKNITKELERTSYDLREAEKDREYQQKEFLNIWQDYRKNYAKGGAGEPLILTKARDDLRETEQLIAYKKLAIKFLRNNAKVAMFAEAMPIALNILERYSGKPYGEKTRSKISDDIRAATGCSMYISRDYFQTYELYNAETRESLTVYPVRNKNGEQIRLLAENEIQVPFLQDLRAQDALPYILDIRAAIVAARKLYAEIGRVQKELETLCGEFNSKYCVKGVDHLRKDSIIYSELT